MKSPKNNLTVIFSTLLLTMLLCISITGLTGVTSVLNLGNRISGIVDTELPRFLAVTDIRKNIRSQLVLQKDYILAESDTEREKIVESISKVHAETLAKMEVYEKISKENQKNNLDNLRRSYKSVKSDELLVIDLAQKGDKLQAGQISKRAKGNPTWEETIKTMIALDETDLKNAIDNTKTFEKRILIAIIVTFFVAILIGFSMGSSIFRRIRSNVNGLIKLQDELRLANQSLESKVQDRTQSIRVLLDNIYQGVMTLERIEDRILISKEHSRQLDEFFDQEYALTDPFESFFNRTDLSLDKIEQIKAALIATLGGDAIQYEINAHLFPKSCTLQVKGLSRVVDLDWARSSTTLKRSRKYWCRQRMSRN